jgi:hypothetical protein
LARHAPGFQRQLASTPIDGFALNIKHVCQSLTFARRRIAEGHSLLLAGKLVEMSTNARGRTHLMRAFPRVPLQGV